MASSELPAGMRNNNPGNIKFSPMIDWQGQVGPSANTDQGDPQVVFDSPQSGMRALAMNVLHKYNNGYTTINQLIAGPGGWTPGYAPGAAGVAAASGLPADQPINMNDPGVLGRVMRGIVTQEQGPSSQQYSDEFIASGIGAAGVKQYDSAGNPIVARPNVANPVSSAPASAKASPAPAVPDVGSILDEALGPTNSASGALRPASQASPAPNVNSILDEALGPSGPQPGTPQYAAMVQNEVNTGQPTPQPATPPPEVGQQPDVVPAPLRAFSENAVNSVPVIGPAIHGARNMVMGTEGGAQMDALGANASAQAPAAAIAGDVFGTVAPLMVAGGVIPGAARVLGMEGGIASRIGFGAASGGLISGADTLARGGTPQQAGQNALTGGAIGGALPVVGKVAGAAKDAFFGPSANKMVANAMVADQNAPANVNQLLQARGPGATVADLGPNTQSLAAGLASLPGEPKSIVVNNLTARAAGTGDRLAADVAGTIGAGQPIGALVDSISAAQKQAADPLYAAVRNVPVEMTPDLHFIQTTPTGSAAFAAAAKTMQDQGRGGSGMTVDFLDKVKQDLDDVASSNYATGKKNAGNNARDMAKSLTAAVDAQVPGYAAARNAFAGPARVKDAVEMGQSIFSSKTSPEDLKSALAGMTPSEKDGLLAGAQAAVQKSIGSARTDAAGVKSIFDSNYGKEKLALLVGQPEADQIGAALERERAFSDTFGKAYRSSITSANQAQQRVINPELAPIPGKIAPQSSLGLLFYGLNKARSVVTSAYRNAQNVKAANMLTAPVGARAGQGIAAAAVPGNALLAPASASLLAKQANVGVGNMLTWANPALLPGPGGPIANPPLRITVRGAAAQ